MAILIKVARICAGANLPETARTEMVTRYSHKKVPQMLFCVRLKETHVVLKVGPQTLWNDTTWFRIDWHENIEKSTEMWF